MTTVFYLHGMEALLSGEIDLVDDTIKAALVDSNYSPDQDNEQYFDEISDEISGTGYTAGGQALRGKTLLKDSTLKRVDFNATHLTWVTATISAAHGVVLYKDTGTAATSPLLCYLDLEADYGSTGEDFTVEWPDVGIFSVPVG